MFLVTAMAFLAWQTCVPYQYLMVEEMIYTLHQIGNKGQVKSGFIFGGCQMFYFIINLPPVGNHNKHSLNEQGNYDVLAIFDNKII